MSYCFVNTLTSFCKSFHVFTHYFWDCRGQSFNQSISFQQQQEIDLVSTQDFVVSIDCYFCTIIRCFHWKYYPAEDILCVSRIISKEKFLGLNFLKTKSIINGGIVLNFAITLQICVNGNYFFLLFQEIRNVKNRFWVILFGTNCTVLWFCNMWSCCPGLLNF